MKLSFEALTFEAGDVLNVEDKFGKESFLATRGHDCGKCVFGAACDRRNPNNRMAKHCLETHFVSCKK